MGARGEPTTSAPAVDPAWFAVVDGNDAAAARGGAASPTNPSPARPDDLDVMRVLRDRARDARLPAEVRRAAAGDAIAARRDALASAASDARRAELLADQAEDLLLLALPLSGDDLIGLFGLAGAAPREGAARIVAEALSSLERSDAIESGNPARSGSNDPAAARRERRSAFLRGIALAIRAELADDPADRHLAYRADAIGALREETRASRDAAIATLSPLLIDLEPTARRLAQVHVALALAGEGRFDEAHALLRLATEESVGAAEVLRAALTGVRIAERVVAGDGEIRHALVEAGRGLDGFVAAASPHDLFTRLLVADARARLRLADATRSSPAPPIDGANAPWVPYRALLVESAGPERAALRPIVLERVADVAERLSQGASDRLADGTARPASAGSDVPVRSDRVAAEIAALPAVARAAMLARAPATRADGAASLAALIDAGALPPLEHLLAALSLADALAARGDAQGAAARLVDAAVRDPQEPEAIAAIERGAALAASLPRAGPDRASRAALLRRALDAAAGFTELPSLDRWRVESARLWLDEQRPDAAIADASAVPAASAWWPAARVVVAAAAAQSARNAAAPERAALWRRAIDEGDATLRSLGAIPAADSRAAVALEAVGRVSLLRAEGLAELGQTDAALRALDALALDAPAGCRDWPGSLRASAQRARVETLARAGREREAAEAVLEMRREIASLPRHPADGADCAVAADTVLGIVGSLLAPRRDQVEALLDEARDREARDLAETSLLPLADAIAPLVDGVDPGAPVGAAPSDTNQRAATWLVAESRRLAGRPAQALPLLDSLLRGRPDAVELLAAKAECMVDSILGDASRGRAGPARSASAPAGGTPATTPPSTGSSGAGSTDPANDRSTEWTRLADAMSILKRIAAGRRAAHDRWFWLAETLQLEILRATGRNIEQIAPRVEQLRAIDPALGGERWRRRLEHAAAGG